MCQDENDSVIERKRVNALMKQGKIDLEMYDIEDYY
jgi:hypothetical protein